MNRGSTKMNKEYYTSTLQSDATVERVRIPKVIAKITLCGAFVMEINEGMNWNPPTPEQIKNLKEILNIDVKLIGEDDDEEK